MEKVGKNVNGHNRQLILTILSALAMGFLIFLVFHINVPNPNMILITAMVFFTSVGGVLPGGVSALMMLLYSMYFFSTNHSFFQYTEINFQKILVIIFGIVVNFIIVALLKRKRDKAERMLMDTNKYLLMSNEYLADKVDTAERITELTQSVSALLTNMPALTFTKDIATGKIWTCKRLYAGNHLDAEPLTASDTAIMKAAYGGSFNYVRRPVLVRYKNHVYAASMYGVPHGDYSIKDNNFNGQFCIHFTGSTTSGTKVVDSAHQSAIKKALNASW